MAEVTIANDITAYLGDVDPSVGTVGTNIFRGPARPFTKSGASTLIPRNCIFVVANTAGDAPVPLAGSAYQKIRTVSAQVIVRNTSAASDSAQTVYNALADLEVSDISTLGYVAFEMPQSNPLYLPGLDNNVDSYWTINIDAIYDQRLVPSGDGELDFSDPDDSGWQSILFGFSP